MKPKIIILSCTAALLAACSPDDPQLFDFSNYTVDKVVCQATSNFLVADGVSQLDLEVKLYAAIEDITDDGGAVVHRIYREIPRARWRDHEIKFFTEDGAPVTPPVTTTSATPATLRYYAEVDGMRSSEPVPQLNAIYAGDTDAVQVGPVYFEVNVRPAIPVTAKKRMPVVFHIVDTEYNRGVGQIIQPDAVYYVIGLWNSVFSRSGDRSSNGANPNLEFVPVLRDPSGKRLENPGVNYVMLTDAEATTLTSQVVSFVWNNSAKMYWDPDKYLNVWVFMASVTPSSTETVKRGYPTVFAEGVYDASALPLPPLIAADLRHLNATDLAAWLKNPGTISATNFVEKVGVLFSKSNFANKTADYITPVSIFMGLIPNASYSESAHRFYGTTAAAKVYMDDQCDDTPIFDIWFWGAPGNGGVQAAGLGSPQIKYMLHAPWSVFRSVNAVDYPASFQTAISQDQVKRINWVLENAPARQPWRNTEAID